MLLQPQLLQRKLLRLHLLDQKVVSPFLEILHQRQLPNPQQPHRHRMLKQQQTQRSRLQAQHKQLRQQWPRPWPSCQWRRKWGRENRKAVLITSTT